MNISVLTRPLSKAYGEEQGLQMIAQAGFDGIDYSMHLHDLGDALFDLPAHAVCKRYETLHKAVLACGLDVCQIHTIWGR